MDKIMAAAAPLGQIFWRTQIRDGRVPRAHFRRDPRLRFRRERGSCGSRFRRLRRDFEMNNVGLQLWWATRESGSWCRSPRRSNWMLKNAQP